VTLIFTIALINLSAKKNLIFSSGANAMSFQVNIVLKATISPKWSPLILTHLDMAQPLCLTSIRDSYSASSLNAGIMRVYHNLILKVD